MNEYVQKVEFVVLHGNHFFGTTPAPVAPVPAAAPEEAVTAFLRHNSLLKKFVTGSIVLVANHGVAQTLTISLKGIRSFVIAYAVASSATSLVPFSPLPNHFPLLVSPLNHPFFRI